MILPNLKGALTPNCGADSVRKEKEGALMPDDLHIDVYALYTKLLLLC